MLQFHQSAYVLPPERLPSNDLTTVTAELRDLFEAALAGALSPQQQQTLATALRSGGAALLESFGLTPLKVIFSLFFSFSNLHLFNNKFCYCLNSCQS